MSLEQLSPELVLENYDNVAAIDPLCVDDFMSLLPKINEQGDVHTIMTAMHDSVCFLDATQGLSQDAALAALRDLDFMMGSTLKHGFQPLEHIAGLEDQLLRLGSVAGTVPRGTVYTYAIANPHGERRRSFTGSHEEEAFIEAVEEGTAALDTALVGLGGLDISDTESLSSSLRDTSDALGVMVNSIVTVMQKVSPEYFTNEMRPFFEPLEIGGRLYTGAGGAQMQLLGIDRILWGMQDNTPEYQHFFEENWQYMTPTQQQAVCRFAEINDESIVGWIASNNSEPGSEMNAATAELLRKIRKFRFPHRKVARDNFNIRPVHAVGSGAYTPTILDTLIAKTEQALAIVEGNSYE